MLTNIQDGYHIFFWRTTFSMNGRFKKVISFPCNSFSRKKNENNNMQLLVVLLELFHKWSLITGRFTTWTTETYDFTSKISIFHGFFKCWNDSNWNNSAKNILSQGLHVWPHLTKLHQVGHDIEGVRVNAKTCYPFLYCETSCFLKTSKKMMQLHMERVENPPYTPDICLNEHVSLCIY